MGGKGSLIERDRELGVLVGALRRSDSSGEVVVVEGPAGIG